MEKKLRFIKGPHPPTRAVKMKGKTLKTNKKL